MALNNCKKKRICHVSHYRAVYGHSNHSNRPPATGPAQSNIPVTGDIFTKLQEFNIRFDQTIEASKPIITASLMQKPPTQQEADLFASAFTDLAKQLINQVF